MHLKNFSLINLPKMGYVLATAYDMVATKLVNPKEIDELALTLNGKKNRLKKSDFIQMFNSMKLEDKQQENIFNKILNAKSKWLELIEISFLSNEMKKKYIELLNDRLERLGQNII